MSKAQLVLTALFVEHQTPAQVAVRYGVHRCWVYKPKARHEAEGEAGFEPRSRHLPEPPRIALDASRDGEGTTASSRLSPSPTTPRSPMAQSIHQLSGDHFGWQRRGVPDVDHHC
ncbi:MAG TPA: hypothetical protein VFD59_07790 [Nocardioidaceae bacterium]|nr:hypothetical protein [Nocardioidaceae bacterium]